jgi:hypothetical protein
LWAVWANQINGLSSRFSSCLDGLPSCLNGPPFSCRVRAGIACRDRGPNTARHRVVPALTLRPSCRVSIRVMFLVSCVVPPVVSDSSGHLYPSALIPLPPCGLPCADRSELPAGRSSLIPLPPCGLPCADRSELPAGRSSQLHACAVHSAVP